MTSFYSRTFLRGERRDERGGRRREGGIANTYVTDVSRYLQCSVEKGTKLALSLLVISFEGKLVVGFARLCRGRKVGPAYRWGRPGGHWEGMGCEPLRNETRTIASVPYS